MRVRLLDLLIEDQPAGVVADRLEGIARALREGDESDLHWMTTEKTFSRLAVSIDGMHEIKKEHRSDGS